MEKISEYVSKRLPPLKIYFEDIEEICNLLEKNAAEVEIHYKGYKLSLKELKEKYFGEYHRKIEIQSSRPYLSVTVAGNGSSIFLYSNDIVSIGLACEIEQVLLNRKSKYTAALESNRLPFSLYTIVLIYGSILFRNGSAELSIVIMLTAFVIYLLWISVSHMISSKYDSLVILRNADQQQSFFKRNKDQISIGIIIAIFSFLLGLAATNFLNK